MSDRRFVIFVKELAAWWNPWHSLKDGGGLRRNQSLVTKGASVVLEMVPDFQT